MDKIIVFPGSADGVFFLNEIDYIKKYFDEVVVITYPGDQERFDVLSREKGFRYFIADINFRNIFSIRFIKWLFCRSTLKEISENLSFSAKSIKKIGYIFVYGLFYLASKDIIDDELNKSKENDDVYLYSFWLTRGAYAISMYKTKENKNIKKAISRAHGYDLYEDRNILNYLPFRKFINNNLDEINFISKHGLEYHTNKYDLIKGDRKISRLGTLNPENITKNITTKDKICIASCSAIIDVKRLDIIIDILSNINIPFKWIHVGDGPRFKEIERMAKEKMSGKDFNFLGRIENNEILNTYSMYDVDFFVNMSDSEGLPVSIMEAMSLGIPVIARNVGGISEIVDGKTGMLINNIENVNQIANIISTEMGKRINDLSYYKLKHEECVSKWKKDYDSDKNYTDFFSSIF